MSKDELHAHAQQSTPDFVQIPNSWAGLMFWAVGKWGVGAIFMGMVWFLYTDLKAANERFAKLTEANVAAITALAQRIDSGHEKIGDMKETIRRIETALSKQ